MLDSKKILLSALLLFCCSLFLLHNKSKMEMHFSKPHLSLGCWNGLSQAYLSYAERKSATKHKSMGLRITKDRIAMLQKTNGSESPVKIIDLEHEDGSAAGTEVIIKMPVLYE